MQILVLGYSESGKTTAAKMVAELIKSPPPKNCSDFIIEDFANEHGLTVQEIIDNKADYRQRLYDHGMKRQNVDPCYPAREAYAQTDVLTGVRPRVSFDAIKEAFDDLLVLWIDREGIKPNSTDKLHPDDADKIIDNNGTIEDLKRNLMEALC